MREEEELQEELFDEELMFVNDALQNIKSKCKNEEILAALEKAIEVFDNRSMGLVPVAETGVVDDMLRESREIIEKQQRRIAELERRQ